jgi:hypothetical protein
MSTKESRESHESPSIIRFPLLPKMVLTPQFQHFAALMLEQPYAPLVEPRQLVYAEYDQDWQVEYVKFTTSCPWSLETLQALCWSGRFGGRISVSFDSFASLLEIYEFSCQEEQRLQQDSFSPAPNVLVKGAIGSY